MTTALTASSVPLPLVRQGKVRDIYDFDDRLLFVATDRISAFDVVLSPGIPDKGKILTQLSNFWFRRYPEIENQLIETEFDRFPASIRAIEELRGRSVIVKKCRVIPVECVARGYLAGSALKEYEIERQICGIRLPAGLVSGSKLPRPIFTPATKEQSGHDVNITFAVLCDMIGEPLAQRLRDLTMRIYEKAVEYAAERGILIADTKFEFGLLHERIVWIDEGLTPDSSRFWPAESYRVGSNPPSYDKQFVRDWLESTGWDKTPPAPELPPEVVRKTREKYLEAYRKLVGGEPEALTGS
jgi:phosphoribosylaminoimidazole-succinocarboxamide synthase